MKKFLTTQSVAALLAVFAITGCSDRVETHLVHGTVVFPNGRPLRRGTVEFETLLPNRQPITASSEIGEDGSFKLGTYELNDGAIAGTHRVAVISDYDIGTGLERPGKIPDAVIHPKYREFKTSGLEFVIQPDMNNILIQVDLAPPPGTSPDNFDATLEDPTTGTELTTE
jgi:hypothetical protein